MIRLLGNAALFVSLLSCSEKPPTAGTATPKKVTIAQAEYGMTYPSGVVECSDDTVQVVAIPEDNYRFVKWVSHGKAALLSDSLAPSITVTALSASGTVLEPIFAPVQCTVVVAYADSSIDNDTVVTDYNTQIYCTAQSRSGYSFKQWVSSDWDRVAIANPTSASGYVTVRASGTLYPTYRKEISSAIDSIHLSVIPASGGRTVPEGMVIVTQNRSVITAIPNEHYRFVKWNNIGTSGTIADSAKATTAITAIDTNGAIIQPVFAPELCTLIVSAPQFSSHKADTIICDYNSSRTITAPAYPGYTFNSWKQVQGTTTLLASFSNAVTGVTVRESGTVQAHYYRINNTITVDTAEHCSLSVTGSFTLSVQDTLTVSCIPAFGYRFVQWVQTGETQISLGDIRDSSIQIAGVKGNGTIKPKVEPVPYLEWKSGSFLAVADSATPLTELYDGRGNDLNIQIGDILGIVYKDAMGIHRSIDYGVVGSTTLAGSLTCYTLQDLLTALSREIGASVTYQNENGAINIENALITNLSVKNMTRPTSNNYVSNLFLWNGQVDGESAGVVRRPARGNDLIKDLFGKNGEPLGLELGDMIRVGGRVNGTELKTGYNIGLSFSDETKLIHLSEYIGLQLAAALDVTVDSSGAILISRDSTTETVLINLSVGASNSNNNATTPTEFNNTMLFRMKL